MPVGIAFSEVSKQLNMKPMISACSATTRYWLIILVHFPFLCFQAVCFLLMLRGI